MFSHHYIVNFQYCDSVLQWCETKLHKTAEAHPDAGCASAIVITFLIHTLCAATAIGAENTTIILRILCGEYPVISGRQIPLL